MASGPRGAKIARAQGVRVEILGTRGEISVSAPAYQRHSGVLIDDRILLDLGERSYLRRHPREIFISHLHPDHAAFLNMPIVVGPKLFVPEPSPKVPGAIVIRRTVRLGSYRVIPVPTRHSVRVRSMGFVVERGRRRIFYSSDLVAIDERYHRRLGRLDLVITEGSFMRRGGLVRVDPATGETFGHAGIPDLVELFRCRARRIVVMHFGSWFYKDIVAARRRIAALGDGTTVTAARDGMIIEV